MSFRSFACTVEDAQTALEGGDFFSLFLSQVLRPALPGAFREIFPLLARVSFRPGLRKTRLLNSCWQRSFFLLSNLYNSVGLADVFPSLLSFSDSVCLPPKVEKMDKRGGDSSASQAVHRATNGTAANARAKAADGDGEEEECILETDL